MSRITKGIAIAILGCTFAASSWAQKAYIANQSSTAVDVVDLNPLSLTYEQQIDSIDTGFNEPYWVSASADGTIVAASLHDADGVAIIDAITDTLIGVVTAGLDDEIEAVAVSPDGSTVYVGSESDDTVFAIDVATLTVVAGPIDVDSEPPNCESPETMVISPDGAYLYLACAEGDSEVVRISTSDFSVTQVFLDDSGDSHGVAISPDGNRVYFSDGSDGFAWNTSTQSVVPPTFTGCEMYGGAVSRDGTRLYCVDEGSTLDIFSTASGALLSSIALGSSSARAVAEGPLARVYVPTSGSDAVEVIDAIALVNLPGNIPLDAGGDGSFDPRGIAIAEIIEPMVGVPTLNNVGLILLVLLLAGLGWLGIAARRRFSA